MRIWIDANELLELGLQPMPLQSLINELICVLRQLGQVDVKHGQCSSLLLRRQGSLVSLLLLSEQVLDQVRVVLQCTLPSLSIGLAQQSHQSVLERHDLTL